MEGEHPGEKEIKKSLEALRKPQQAASRRDPASRARNFTAWAKTLGLSLGAEIKTSNLLQCLAARAFIHNLSACTRLAMTNNLPRMSPGSSKVLDKGHHGANELLSTSSRLVVV